MRLCMNLESDHVALLTLLKTMVIFTNRFVTAIYKPATDRKNLLFANFDAICIYGMEQIESVITRSCNKPFRYFST